MTCSVPKCALALSLILAISLPGVVSASQDSGDPIVVKGTRLDPRQARQRAEDFVKRAGVANGQKQVARWIEPVCLKVTGISDAQATRVAATMTAVARAAAIPLARAGCTTNANVIFTVDPDSLVQKIASRRAHQFNEVPMEQRANLMSGDAPVRWWYSTQMLDRDGVAANNISAPWISTDEGAQAVSLPIFDGVTATQQYNGGSNVRTPTVRSLYAATVVVDAARVGDARLDSIARYAAMVAFAELRAADPPPDSILALFLPDRTETDITDWDLAFLKSLYRMPIDRRSRIQRGHLVEALLDERVGRAEKPKKP